MEGLLHPQMDRDLQAESHSSKKQKGCCSAELYKGGGGACNGLGLSQSYSNIACSSNKTQRVSSLQMQYISFLIKNTKVRNYKEKPEDDLALQMVRYEWAYTEDAGSSVGRDPSLPSSFLS